MYQLDIKAAHKADSSGAFITELGKYVGKFTQAVDITASTGTRGIALQFESNGQKANLPLYVQRANGENIMGFQVLSAIMACLKLRGIKPQEGSYKEYDFDAKEDVTQKGMIFPELCNKPIGLLLETEDYLTKQGVKRTRMVLKSAFQADTELTASEILDRKTTPEKLEKLVAQLRHRPLKDQPHRSESPAPMDDDGFENNDDIPF